MTAHSEVRACAYATIQYV